LASALVARGHAVRGTTRSADRVPLIEASGAEAVVADPDRVGTLSASLSGVGVLCVLLGSARGSVEAIQALHGSRLEMLLSRVIDTTVRGVVYEGAGAVDDSALRSGASVVRAACAASRIPCVVLDADPADHEPWLEAALAAIDRVLQIS
jgi:uncharacterized protein YbjT (DUF2867 family)